jgi:hypothetical protein
MMAKKNPKWIGYMKGSKLKAPERVVAMHVRYFFGHVVVGKR